MIFRRGDSALSETAVDFEGLDWAGLFARIGELGEGDTAFFPDGDHLHRQVASFRHTVWLAGRECCGKRVEGGYQITMLD